MADFLMKRGESAQRGLDDWFGGPKPRRTAAAAPRPARAGAGEKDEGEAAPVDAVVGAVDFWAGGREPATAEAPPPADEADAARTTEDADAQADAEKQATTGKLEARAAEVGAAAVAETEKPAAKPMWGATQPTSGERLPEGLAATYGQSLGFDLSEVRLHTGGGIAEAAGARAVTHGTDIAFAHGALDLDRLEGHRLLAHELTHVVQQAQGGAAPQRKPLTSEPREPTEIEADAAADALVCGHGPVRVAEPAEPERLHCKKEFGDGGGPDGGVPTPELTKGQVLLDRARAAVAAFRKVGDALPSPAATTSAAVTTRLANEKTARASAFAAVMALEEQLSVQMGPASDEADQSGRGRAGVNALLSGLTSVVGDQNRVISDLDRKETAADSQIEALKRREETEKAAGGSATTNKPRSGSHDTTTTSEDGKLEQKTSVGGSVEDGKGTGNAGGEVSHVDDEAKRKSTTKASTTGTVTTTGGTLGGSYEHKTDTGYDQDAHEKHEIDVDQKKREFEEKKARGEIPEDAKFDPPPGKTYAGSSTKATGALSVDSQTGTTASGGLEKTKTAQDGSSATGGVTVNAGVDKDGKAQGGGSVTLGSKDAKGNEASATGSVQVDAKGAQVGAGVQVKDKGGADGQVILKDGEKGAKGSVTAGGPAKSFKVGGGKVVTFSSPVELPSEQWSVTYTVAYSAELGGQEKTDPKLNKPTSVGGSASVNANKTVAGTKLFGSLKEAEAFRAAENIDGLVLPATARDAHTLKPGESIQETDGAGVEAAGTVSSGGVDVSAGAGRSKAEGVRVEMKQGNIVSVSKTVRVDDKVKGSVGAGVSYGGQVDEMQATTIGIEVDIGAKESPNEAGEQAYQTFMATGEVVAPARVVYTSKTTGNGNQIEVSALGIKWLNRSETSDTESHDADGNKIEESTGKKSKALTISLPIIGSQQEETFQLRGVQVNDGNNGYVLETTVNDSGLDNTQKALAKATNTGGVTDPEKMARDGASTSGKWKVQTMMSSEAMDHFIDQVKHGKVDPTSTGRGSDGEYTGNFYGASKELQQALKEAGDDKDAQRQAMAKFVANGGDLAISQIQSYGGSHESVLTLEGKDGKVDPNFRGVEGRIEMESKIADYEHRMASVDGSHARTALAMEIKASMAEARRRIAHINPENYPDLPPELMAREQALSSGDVSRLSTILAKVREPLDQQREDEARDPNARKKRIDAENAKHADDPIHMTTTADPREGHDPVKMSQMAMKFLRANQAEASAAEKTARAARRDHRTGGEGYTYSRSPQQRLEDGDKHAAELYAQAEGQFAAGSSSMQTALSAEATALSHPDFTDEQIEAIAGEIENAGVLFLRARDYFRGYSGTVDVVAKGHPDECRF